MNSFRFHFTHFSKRQRSCPPLGDVVRRTLGSFYMDPTGFEPATPSFLLSYETTKSCPPLGDVVRRTCPFYLEG